MEGLPNIMFGAAALCACALALLLPETSEVALPDDVQDVEQSTAITTQHNDVENTGGTGDNFDKSCCDDVKKSPKSKEKPEREVKRVSFYAVEVTKNDDEPPMYPADANTPNSHSEADEPPCYPGLTSAAETVDSKGDDAVDVTKMDEKDRANSEGNPESDSNTESVRNSNNLKDSVEPSLLDTMDKVKV